MEVTEQVKEVKKASTTGGGMGELLEGRVGKAEGGGQGRNSDLYHKSSKKH